MFGASGKSGRGGRGGGGAGGKRKLPSNFKTASRNRPSGGHHSAADSRNNRTTTATPAAVTATATATAPAEETYSLVTGNPLDFAMIIRLTPDLVDEIKRAESHGGSAKIKFDANANNASGNVIDVGGKDFRFTWSKEMGDLCDIYQERQSGEEGNGLLVESGCAWRKLNVQRVLDESTKNHVKMRSEEAERKSKSRKVTILDHGSPSMKSQMMALAAAEATRKMPFKQKKEPPYRKRTAEPLSGPPKSAHKHGLSSTTSKGRTSASPLPSTPEQPYASASPFGAGNLSKGYASVEDNMPTQVTSKEKASISEKGTPNRVTTNTLVDKPVRQGNLGVKSADLRSMLIFLLTENPRGMSLKALEKSVGPNFPNSGRQIEPILKKIATYQAPGRYILKSGAELESLKKPVSESGSSPENNQQQTPGPGDNCDDRRDPENSVSVKTHTQNYEPTNLNSEPGKVLTDAGKIKSLLPSPDHHAEKKASDNSEGLVATSGDSGSDSESDSESDSTNSESHRRGRSRSKSPVGSGSGSSSDSESDASSNSKEGSDEEVDIMTSDDDKDPKGNLQAPEPERFTSPIPWRPDGLLVQNTANEKEDSHASRVTEITENSRSYALEAEIDAYNGSVFNNKEGEKHAQAIKPSSDDCAVLHRTQVYTGDMHRERDDRRRDGFRHEPSDRYQRKSEGKSNRWSDEKYFDDNDVRSKKIKAGSVTQAPISEDSNFLFSGSFGKRSPGRPIEGLYEARNTQITDKAAKDRTDFGLQRTYNPSNPGKVTPDSQMSSPRPVDISGLAKAPSTNDRPGRNAENLGSSVKFTERSLQMPEGLPNQKDKVNGEIPSEDGYSNDRRPPKNPRDGGVDKNSAPTDSHYRKRGEFAGKMKEGGSVLSSHVTYPSKDSDRSDIDRSPIINGRGPNLRREASELEPGELHDPLPEETPGIKKQSDRKYSFKQSENKLTSFDYWNPDIGKGKPAGRTSVDPVKPSPPNSNVGVIGNHEESSKTTSPGHYEDSTKAPHKVVQCHPPQLPRVSQAEVVSQLTNLSDGNSKSRRNEAVSSQGIGLEEYGNAQIKVPVATAQLHDDVQGRPQSTRESKRRKTNSSADLSDICKEHPIMDGHAGGKKNRVSFPDNKIVLYCKYKKDKPELKGPIKDHSQYMEYVKEFEEKYDSYFSINKILESERNEFLKFGRDLEAAKGKDMNKYHSILEELKESYRRCGTTHKRLKKVFLVLHKELERLKEMIKEYANPCPKD